ncbi:MAG: hypothetical protein KDA55_17995 [Planctomycetales bacterium]|nr:hypothetical protein [Planctomycetales bacterium]
MSSTRNTITFGRSGAALAAVLPRMANVTIKSKQLQQRIMDIVPLLKKSY